MAPSTPPLSFLDCNDRAGKVSEGLKDQISKMRRKTSYRAFLKVPVGPGSISLALCVSLYVAADRPFLKELSFQVENQDKLLKIRTNYCFLL